MSSLHFFYGTMNASKSANLLTKTHNFEEYGNKVLLFVPKQANRDGKGIIKSRALGEQRQAIIVEEDVSIYNLTKQEKPDFILSDESQFFEKKEILEFARVVDELNIPVFCFGLLLDFKAEMFTGSYHLMCYADAKHELTTVCAYCRNNATMVLRLDKDGNVTREGEQIKVGYGYKSVCRNHWIKGGE